MVKKRVVITGVGTVNPLGNNYDEFIKNLFEGKNAISVDDFLESSGIETNLLALVKDFKLRKHLPNKKMRKLLNNGEGYGLVSAIQAMNDSLILSERDIAKEDFGIFLGCTKEFAPFDRITESLEASLEDGVVNAKRFGEVAPYTIQPLIILESIPNACIEYVSELFDIGGDNLQVMTNGVASTQAIGLGYKSILRGDSTAALCGGFDSLTETLNIAAFDSLGLLTNQRDYFSGPFDKDRNGFVMGEGAGMLVLEEYEHARNRGAKIYAEITGYYTNHEGNTFLDIDPEGKELSECINGALQESNVPIESIGFINCYSSGTKIGDSSELNAINSLFDSDIYLSANKGAFGHLIGASGAVETIATIASLNRNEIPENLIKKVDNPFPNLKIETQKVKISGRNAIKISRGMGGENTVLVLKGGIHE